MRFIQKKHLHLLLRQIVVAALLVGIVLPGGLPRTALAESAPEQSVSEAEPAGTGVPPEEVRNLDWSLIDYNRVQLEWEKPLLSDGTGEDPDIEKYEVYDYKTKALVAETEETHVVIGDLSPKRIYTFVVKAVNKEGERSEGEYTYAGTSPQYSAELTSAPIMGGDERLLALSADGSTLLLAGDRNSSIYEYKPATNVLNTLPLTTNDAKLDRLIEGLSVSGDGSVMTFATAASNVKGFPQEADANPTVYVYDIDHDSLQAISPPGVRSINPSISADGDRIVYAEGDQVYLYERKSDTRILVSVNAEGQPSDDFNRIPVISADGKYIAYASTASDLAGVPEDESSQSLIVYDVEARAVDSYSQEASTYNRLAISDDGSRIAFVAKYGGFAKPHVFDRTTGQTKYLNDDRPAQEDKNKAYTDISISGDGKTIAADLLHHDKAPGQASAFGERFDLTVNEDGEIAVAAAAQTFNPSYTTTRNTLNHDGKRLYLLNVATLYVECSEACGSGEPSGAVQAMSWSVPGDAWVNEELKQGTTLSLQATGQPGLEVEAVVDYSALNESGSSENKQAVVQLTEDTQAAGVYRGQWQLPAGTSAVDKLSARQKDAGAAVSAPGTPVRIAGTLRVTLSGSAALPETMTLTATHEGKSAVSKSIGPGSQTYDLPLTAGTAYTVKLTAKPDDGGEVELAAAADVQVKGGAVTPLSLTPILPAVLQAKVEVYGEPGEELKVVFKKDGSDEPVAEVKPDGNGIATLPGSHLAGEAFKVSVAVPAGYVAGAEQRIELRLGTNTLRFTVKKADAVVRNLFMNYEKKLMGTFESLPVQDSDSTLIVESDAGQQLAADVSYSFWESQDAAEPVKRTARITLAEREGSGRYEGSFRIAAGVSRIESVRVIYNGRAVDRDYPIGQNVAGRLTLRMPSPQKPLEGWEAAVAGSWLRVAYSNDKYMNFAWSGSLGDNLTQTIDVPFPGVDYAATLMPKSGSTLSYLQFTARQTGYGRSDIIEIPAAYNVALAVALRSEGGTEGAAKYWLTDPAGAVVSEGSAWIGQNGALKLTLRLSEAGTYRLKLVPNDPAYMPAEQSIVIDSFDVRASMTVHPKPLAKLEGVVKDKDGAAAAGAQIVAELVDDGKSKLFYTKSNAAGAYSLELPQGQILLRAISASSVQGYQSQQASVKLVAGQTKQQELRIVDYADVGVKLYTLQPGGTWQGPLSLDAFVAGTYKLGSDRIIQSYQSRLSLRALPGETVEICADGRDLNLSAECKTTVIGQNGKADIELRLKNETSAAAVRLLGPDGKPLTGAFVYLFNEQGEYVAETSYRLASGEERGILKLQGSGRYKATFYSDGSFADVSFSTVQGETTDLGVLKLQAYGAFASGKIRQAVTVSDSKAAPGGTTTLRVLYQNYYAPTIVAEDAEIVVALPEGVEPIEGTAIAAGKAASFKLEGRNLILPVGKVADSAQQSAQVKLRFNEAMGAEPALQASIRYKMKGEQSSELLGMVVLSKVRVTLRAPALTVKRQLSLGGSAPAGAAVTIYDGEDKIGSAKANSSGLWWADAQLSGSDGVYREHRLAAEAVDVDGARVAGEEAAVVYDPNDPGLESMTIVSNRKEVTFNVEGGVAVFPLSVVNHAPISYTLNFRDSERIYDVRVQNGDVLSQATKGADGVYRGVIPFTQNFGQVWVDYRTKADAAELAGRPAIPEAELRSSLPALLRDIALTRLTEEGEQTPGGEKMPAGAFEADVQLAKGITSTVRAKFDSVAYTTSERDQAWQARTGLPVFNFTESYTERQDGSLQASVSFVMPAPSASARGIQGVSVGGIGITLNTLVKFGDAGFKGWSAAKAGQDSLANYRRAQDLLKAAEAICDPQAREYYTNFAKEAVFDVNAHFTVNNALKVIKNFGKIDKGPAVLFSAASEYASTTFKEVENNEMDELEAHIKQYSCKLKPYPPTDRKDPPAAAPKYIWDPSGYVYEGMPSNRVEGATATVMELVGNDWTVWDSEWYGQENPQLTDREGRYGWDVPEGKWKVRYEKEGYETAYSDALDVPPPQLEVNVPIVSYAAPEVELVRPAPGGAGVTVYFTKPMNVGTLDDAFTLKDSAAADVEGTVEAQDVHVDKNGLTLAMAAKFVPAAALQIGESYALTVRGTAQSYARVPMGEDAAATFTVEAADTTPPADVAALEGGMTDEGMLLTWSDPSDKDLAAVRVYWKKASDAAYGQPVTVPAGTMWAAVPGLDAGAAYEFKVAAVDEAGNEARGAAYSWTPQGVADITAPLPVSTLAASAVGSDAIRLTWIDPPSADLAKLRIEWRAAGSAGEYAAAEAEKGKGEYTVGGLKPLTEYELRVFAIDASDNTSKSVGVSASTGASGQGGEPGGQGGQGGQGGGNPADPNEESADIGDAGASLSFFGGKLKLHLPGGGGTAGAAKKVTVSKVQNASAPADTHLRPLSDVYAWKLDTGGRLSAAAKLTIAYDAAKLGGADIRKLGLYRQDDADKSRWKYVGGIVDGASGTAEADVTEPGAYMVMVAEYTFADLTNHWSRGDVEVLAARGVVTGDPDGSFRPNGSVTRAEFVKLLLPLLAGGDGPGMSGPKFTDVASDAWYAEAVGIAAAAGIVQGANGKFRPSDPITREEMAVMLYRTLGIVTDDLDPAQLLGAFADGVQVSGWAKMQVAYAVKAGLLKGSGGKLHPQATATRAEAATVVLRTMDALGRIVKKG